ncbi:3-oxoacyl-ACP reductase FabG [Thiomicrospira cyclica]|uniref:3-oxoacyl-[acyl-carrier-protein] reductase n=1 Tax=Thiomicrospira cyclica (strain DSM 14477 / JCM 11371 / ALM1) TaxID=717773 RepID=F6D8Q9_THICA|nr:3-oxoacyl-ACP reductase FabG [Thiomicrospira cyclica]AEG31910.1 3-oxoacyl-(acyl-carrier-protein) reductase [Thiomicrospira cyclica ALM1]
MLEGQIALVTGASRGIGKAIAVELAQQGATVIGTATSEAGAAQISQYLADAGLKGEGHALNVTEPDQITALMDWLTSAHGTPTILVNNAGITRDNLLMRMKDDEWNDIIQTNLNSVYRMSKACLRGMMKQKNGRIINVASVVGVMGNAGQTNYAAAKAGIIGFAKSLAREVGTRGITVNTVAPGFIDTDMTRDLAEEHRQQLINQIPLARLGQPEDIAKSVAFLASPGAAYITGQTINVNGGMVMI